jgi:hypothetical protein
MDLALKARAIPWPVLHQIGVSFLNGRRNPVLIASRIESY